MLCLAVFTAALVAAQQRPYRPVWVEPGSLIARASEIVLPLKHTSVNASVSGFGAQVTVVQTFTNPTDKPIEAVYTFPLPADSAVNRMRMQVGDRVTEGVVRRREEARAIYEAAKTNGQAAALLDQERPNIFTQSVANILPKSTVKIEISYVQILKYEDGQFEFTYPMVVGPRYLGNAPDPGKIAPPVIPPGMRTGQTIDLNVNLNAGAPITDLKSVLHDITTRRSQGEAYAVSLRKADEIPNKDFILRYRVATDFIQSGFLAKYDPLKGGFFSLILMPPKQPAAQQISPKQMIFVMDQSGSQTGFPIEKSKELTLKLIDTMNPGDTFNVMGFSVNVNTLWPEPRPNTPANRAEAKAFVSRLGANGGTELRRAVEAALLPAPDPKRTRIVIFNTDGFVGDEAAVLKSVREHRGDARMFTFGIGNGVNHYLIDAMSEEGRGDSETVTLPENADAAVTRFVKRLHSPVLMDVHAKFEGVEVSDELPSHIPDVFGDKPIVIYGRYATPGRGKLTLSGTMGGEPWSQTIDLTFPSDLPGGDSIPALWARRMVDKIQREGVLEAPGGSGSYPVRYDPRVEAIAPEAKNRIIDLATEYGLITDYTSFVAVEQRVINIGGHQRTVHVPVEMTEGVSYRAIDTPTVGLQYAAGATFGGGGGLGGGAKVDDQKVRRKVAVRHADPLLVGGLDSVSGRPATFEDKVSEKLLKAAGPVEIEVWLTDLTPKIVAKLKKARLTVDVEDKSLKLVCGRCDAKLLKALAAIEEVKFIEPIS